MARKFHIEVDERRRSGDIKGALDLARYAHGELSSHQLLKRSYAWALYSYLKHKITTHRERLSQSSLNASRELMSDHPRRREVNLLCREYRRHKLPTSDLCLSLTLRQLCRISPAPLGLYGLLKWAGLDGLRDEDVSPEPERPHEPPLILILADHLTSLINTLDQELMLGLTPRVTPQQVAVLAATYYERLISLEHSVSTVTSSHPHQTEANPADVEPHVLNATVTQTPCAESWIKRAMWGGCWTRRRAGDYRESLAWAQKLAQRFEPTPELWWEVAQSLAQEAYIPDYLTASGEVEAVGRLTESTSSESPPLFREALCCALRAAHEARSRGVVEVRLAELYARASVWAELSDQRQLATSLMWWAIELRKRAGATYPYNWNMLSSAWGQRPLHPWNILSEASRASISESESIFMSESLVK